MDEIKSLQDFITLIDDKYDDHWYFRGESKDYGITKNLASGYRWMVDNKKTFVDLLNLRKEFFREVGGNLTQKEIENFLSYSQHHGLPTELLDITANPLVALYFACDSNPKEDGFLYLFSNSIKDDNLYPRQFYSSPYRDLTKKLYSQDISQQHIFFRWFEDIDDSMIQKDLMEESNQFTYYLFQDSDFFKIQDESEKVWNEYSIKYPELAKVSYSKNKFLSQIKNKNYSRSEEISKRFDPIIGLTFSLIGMNMENGMYFPSLKYLLVKPTIIFDRMKNQQGLFIYQLREGVDDEIGDFQPIIPAVKMNIPASKKAKIMKQLNLMGINRKFIYSDDDNVAAYLKENYNESFYREMHPYSNN
ncbi:FRG domain-containing protein [Fructilactobacillus myrtifloralis]|uniref:FRG domain-containing protein n=1 Tax=Fructilactobacillus myrtifloralis TaxID=2940301 RepID=A0ABY5BPV9_9LACO|nr:FRG domain-containing protein [Fructilactobacillus myrtifloralis]USS85595.1 FRG domain-containing protein [Fructilactobacillus myrtifloralis]